MFDEVRTKMISSLYKGGRQDTGLLEVREKETGNRSICMEMSNCLINDKTPKGSTHGVLR